MSDRDRAIAIVEGSRRTHVEWLTWQETTPDWRSQVKPESPGGPAHHRKAIEEYDLVLSVLRQAGELRERLRRAESALRFHGYRESCDIPACNCGDQWMHGGLADARLREIREELGELANGKSILGAVKQLRSDLDRRGGKDG